MSKLEQQKEGVRVSGSPLHVYPTIELIKKSSENLNFSESAQKFLSSRKSDVSVGEFVVTKYRITDKGREPVQLMNTITRQVMVNICKMYKTEIKPGTTKEEAEERLVPYIIKDQIKIVDFMVSKGMVDEYLDLGVLDLCMTDKNSPTLIKEDGTEFTFSGVSRHPEGWVSNERIVRRTSFFFIMPSIQLLHSAEINNVSVQEEINRLLYSEGIDSEAVKEGELASILATQWVD